MKLYGMMVFMDIPQYNVNMEKIFQGFTHILTNTFHGKPVHEDMGTLYNLSWGLIHCYLIEVQGIDA